jgi:hypothetical protein
LAQVEKVARQKINSNFMTKTELKFYDKECEFWWHGLLPVLNSWDRSRSSILHLHGAYVVAWEENAYKLCTHGKIIFTLTDVPNLRGSKNTRWIKTARVYYICKKMHRRYVYK